MGSWWSDNSVTRVAVLGLSESGKSHFLHSLRGDAPPTRPTNGRDQERSVHEGQQLDFTEFGFLTSIVVRGGAATVAQGQDYECVMWFVDEHDCEEEIYNARSMVMQFAEGRRPPILCIVQNVGRPFERRHVLRQDRASGSWIWSETENVLLGTSSTSSASSSSSSPYVLAATKALQQHRPVTWERLQVVARVDGLKKVYSRVAFVQLSYTDPESATYMLNWIVCGQGDK